MQNKKENVHTHEQLKAMQSLPLNLKVALTKDRIRGWVKEYGIDGVYVAFSGGKDSTCLLHIARSIYPEIKAVYCNTTNEYPQIVEFVKTFDNVDIVTPEIGFRAVLQKYGYPVISKEVSECVYHARKYLSEIASVGGGTSITETSQISCLAKGHIDARLKGQRHTAEFETDRILGLCHKEVQQAVLSYADNLASKSQGGGGAAHKWRRIRGLSEYSNPIRKDNGLVDRGQRNLDSGGARGLTILLNGGRA